MSKQLRMKRLTNEDNVIYVGRFRPFQVIYKQIDDEYCDTILKYSLGGQDKKHICRNFLRVGKPRAIQNLINGFGWVGVEMPQFKKLHKAVFEDEIEWVE